MPTFTMRPDGMGTRGTWTDQGGGTTDLHLSVDDYLAGGAKDDDTTYIIGPNNGNSTIFLLLDATPSDFTGTSSITSITRKFAYRLDSAGISGPADEVALNFQLVRSDESTNITSSQGISVTSGTYVETSAAMNLFGSSTKAEWDGARILLEQAYTQNGCADTTTRIRITALEITVTYNVPSMKDTIGRGVIPWIR